MTTTATMMMTMNNIYTMYLHIIVAIMALCVYYACLEAHHILFLCCFLRYSLLLLLLFNPLNSLISQAVFILLSMHLYSSFLFLFPLHVVFSSSSSSFSSVLRSTFFIFTLFCNAHFT